MGKYFLYALGVLLTSASYSVKAQEVGRMDDVESRGTSYRVFARSGEATIQVLVLGTVGSDGIYEIAEGTRLDELFALVGGPALGPRDRGQRREVTLRLFRDGAEGRALVYEAQLDQMLANPASYPMLREGDVFTVEAVQWSRFRARDYLRIITSAAALYLAIDRITRIFRR